MQGQLSAVMLVRLGPLVVSNTVLTTWGLMVFLVLLCRGRHYRSATEPTAWEIILEGVVLAIQDAINAVLPEASQEILPFVGSLWIYLAAANLTGILPGLHSPTADLSTTAGLAFLVFLSVHWYGIRIHGFKRYLRHYLEPNPILLPFHLVSELSRTVALAVRLFGNMFSLEMAALLVIVVAGFLAPIPILFLHIIEALVQAYIFGMLALVYIAGGIQSLETKTLRKEGITYA
jgi:F-type H+-transporting ATPase subunit a